MLRWLWAVMPSSRASAEVLDADVGLGAARSRPGPRSRRRRGRPRGRPWCRSPAGARPRSRPARPPPPPRPAARRRSGAAGRTGASSAPRPSPWPTAIAQTPARSSAAATVATWSGDSGGRSRASRRAGSCRRSRIADGVLMPAAPACSSATRTAAVVMMSRLPAYARQVVAGALDLEHHGGDAVGDQGPAVAGGSPGRRRRPRPPPRRSPSRRASASASGTSA